LARRSYLKGTVPITKNVNVVYIYTIKKWNSHIVFDYIVLSVYHLDSVPFRHSKPKSYTDFAEYLV